MNRLARPAAALAALLFMVTLPAPAAAQPPDPHAGHVMPPQAPDPHAGHRMDQVPAQPPPDVPALTDADRAAAFPDVQGHATRENAVHYFVLFDQFEWQAGSGSNGLSWDNKGWVGTDTNRLWFRSEGDAAGGTLSTAQAHVMWGRPFARWWDVVAGIRQDVRPGSPHTWAAVGLQGLAPYWFEVDATAYVGASGRTHARFEVEYELLLTNRLMLQPVVELEVAGKADPERGVGAGLSTADAGLRLRYEIRRELAPYVGVSWQSAFGKTADYARAAGKDAQGVRMATGLRWWF